MRFAAQREKLEKAGSSSRRGSRVDDPAAYHAENVLWLAPEARFDYLPTLPEGGDVGAKVNGAMREIEKHNPASTGYCPDLQPVHQLCLRIRTAHGCRAQGSGAGTERQLDCSGGIGAQEKHRRLRRAANCGAAASRRVHLAPAAEGL